MFPIWYLVFRYLLRLCSIATVTDFQLCFEYEACLESIQPFWISWELVLWPWCNLAASQWRPYCASVNSHSPVGLVIRQWDTINWACALCDLCIHKYPHFQRWFYLWEKPEVTGTQIWAVGVLTDLSDAMFCQKNPARSRRMGRHTDADSLICSLSHCEFDGHTVYKLSQWCLTAIWLAPWESNCSQMYSKVSSDWLPSYIKATQPVLEIFEMAGYFPDRLCI